MDGDEAYPTICGTGTEDYFCGSYNFENLILIQNMYHFPWGEGEIKFFMDGDEAYPTICGTGTEDYFCGSYNFENLILIQNMYHFPLHIRDCRW